MHILQFIHSPIAFCTFSRSTVALPPISASHFFPSHYGGASLRLTWVGHVNAGLLASVAQAALTRACGLMRVWPC